MYWWEHAARAVRSGTTRRFGFITTNSLRQTFNRRVVEKHLHPRATVASAAASPKKPKANGAKNSVRPEPKASFDKLRMNGGLKAAEIAAPQTLPALRLDFAIPDHPWVDNADGAAVRIAMTVGSAPPLDDEGTPAPVAPGCLQTVTHEAPANDDGEVAVTLSEQLGEIHADLTIGADIASAESLRANADISNRGVQLFGAGFIVTEAEAATLLPPPAGEGRGGGVSAKAATSVIREYRNGRDLTDTPRNVKVIDLFGLTADEVR